ncbi:MAG: DUF4173 domain-containing protein [Planctomycetota bacterium]
MNQINRWWRFGLPVVAGVSLLSAALADFLFYDQVVGWTLGGFVAWLLLVLLLRNGRSLLAGRRRGWGWSLSAMTLGLCISLALEPGSIAIILSLILLSTLAMLAHGWSPRRLGWRWLWLMGWSWLLAAWRPIRDSRLARRWAMRTRGLRSRAMGAARWAWAFAGIVIPLALSLVFLGLFALANPVVSDWMRQGSDRVGDFFSNLTDYITVGRVLLWYIAAFLCWGLLRHRPRRHLKFRRIRRAIASIQPNDDSSYGFEVHPVQATAEEKRQSEPVAEDTSEANAPTEPAAPSEDILAWLAGKYQNLVVRCLIAMNLVFALQLVLDSRYLVLGQDLPAGMTYAEYAHRGAYPLIATAILAAALVLAVFRPSGIAQRSKLAVYLVLLWITQNIVLVVSAAWRLQAYVEVYTLTRLRVAAAVWMLMVAGCLALLLWRIARSRDNNWLTGWAMGWGIAVLWVCSFVPFDPLIAGYNVRNCKELGGKAGPIDIVYLEHLGPDALPAIELLIDKLPAEYAQASPGSTAYGNYSRERAPRLRYASRQSSPPRHATLDEHLRHIQADLTLTLEEQLEDWRGWTARRSWLEGYATRE